MWRLPWTAAAFWLAAQPAAAVVLAPGDLVAVLAERQIQRIDRATGALDLISQGGIMSTVYGMAFEPSGKLLVLGLRTAPDPQCGNQPGWASESRARSCGQGESSSCWRGRFRRGRHGGCARWPRRPSRAR